MPSPLPIYQEILLLALRDDRGTPLGAWTLQALAGGALADLLLAGRVGLEGKRSLVTPLDAEPINDPVLDDCLLRIAESKRRAPASTWVARLAKPSLYHDAATRLCEDRILRADTKSVLMFFTRKIYPEADPKPEQEIIARLRGAIFTDQPRIDARTTILVSLASATDLLAANFPRKELRARRKRIESLKAGELVGEATAAAVQAVQAAATMVIVVSG